MEKNVGGHMNVNVVRHSTIEALDFFSVLNLVYYVHVATRQQHCSMVSSIEGGSRTSPLRIPLCLREDEAIDVVFVRGRDGKRWIRLTAALRKNTAQRKEHKNMLGNRFLSAPQPRKADVFER